MIEMPNKVKQLKPRAESTQNTEEILEELLLIRRLLILQLLNDGMSGNSIAKFISMDQGNFSRMYPTRGVQFKKRS